LARALLAIAGAYILAAPGLKTAESQSPALVNQLAQNSDLGPQETLLHRQNAKSAKVKREEEQQRKAKNNNDLRSPEPGAERFQLANGLTVMLRPIKGARMVALIVLYSIGADHDPEGRSGLAHMVEHVYVTAAAGQEKARTVDQFARRYQGQANAQTGDRHTVIGVVFPEKELDRELADAGARMGSLQITNTDLDRERPRLLEEIGKMFGQFPPLAALNVARELARPTPRGGRHGGLPEHIRGITIEEIQAHWQRYYKPKNAVVVLAGAVDSAPARRAISDHFAKLPAGQDGPPAAEPGKPRLGTTSELVVKSALPGAESTACLAYAAPPPDSDLYPAFLVMIARLWSAGAKLRTSGSMDSPVYFTPLDDGTVAAVSTAAKPRETAESAFARIEKLVGEALGLELRPLELTSTRQQLGFLLGMAALPDAALAQNPYGVAFSLGRRVQWGIDPAKLNRALSAVTDGDLRRVATEVFGPARHTGAFISVSQ
jgi:zinc protease